MAVPTLQSWDGAHFVNPDAKNSDTLDNVHGSGYAAASHQHIRASITDFAHKSTHAIGGNDVLTPSDIGALSLSGGILTGRLALAGGSSGGVSFPDNSGSASGITMQTPDLGQTYAMTFAMPNEAGNIFNFKGVDANAMKVNNNTVWNAGNFNPTSKSDTTHNHTYNVNDPWLRYNLDSANVKIYGATRQIAFRTDGTAEYATGIGAYPFVWTYGGDAAANRLLMVDSAGDLYTKANGWMSATLGNKVDKTSTVRPGVTRLYRRDDNTNYSVQIDYSGTYWQLRGYSADTYHADCYVGQAGNSDTVDGLHGADLMKLNGMQTLVHNVAAGTASWSSCHLELRDATGNGDVALAFHRPGKSATSLMHNGNGLILQDHGGGNDFRAGKVYGAVYNDYAEYRQSKEVIPGGLVAVEGEDGYIENCTKRRSKGAMIASDTYGFSIGEQDIEDETSVPIAVAGRVLVYTDRDRTHFKVGDAVCSGKEGTVSKMSWWERILFPDRIIGIVSEIPEYETWGSDNVFVGGRIWVRVK